MNPLSLRPRSKARTLALYPGVMTVVFGMIVLSRRDATYILRGKWIAPVVQKLSLYWLLLNHPPKLEN